MTTCSKPAGQDGAAAREGCRTVPVDPEWQAEQVRKNESYSAYRKRYALVNHENALRINPALKDWMLK